jgi:predicted metal-binding membrane protein
MIDTFVCPMCSRSTRYCHPLGWSISQTGSGISSPVDYRRAGRKLHELSEREISLLAVDPTTRARTGAGVLLVAGIYQLTPLKRICLRHCRSPLLLVMQHGQAALRSRFGATRAGLAHGGYCLGCCWALMGVLVAAGVMSLTWMATIAAVIAMEKLHRHGELISRILGGLTLVVALALLVEPAALPAMS